MYGELNMPDDKQITLVAALIDESGSMGGIADDTIGGYNAFIANIQTEQAGKEAYVSTFLFDSRSVPSIREIQNGNNLAKAIPLTHKNYRPQAATPLYDAIGLTISKIDQIMMATKATKVTFIIQTDGEENCSQEFSHAAVKKLIEARTEAGWQIVFLGADLGNAHEIGTNLGVLSANSMTYAKGKTLDTFNSVSTATSTYRSAVSASANITLTDKQKQDLAT